MLSEILGCLWHRLSGRVRTHRTEQIRCHRGLGVLAYRWRKEVDSNAWCHRSPASSLHRGPGGVGDRDVHLDHAHRGCPRSLCGRPAAERQGRRPAGQWPLRPVARNRRPDSDPVVADEGNPIGGVASVPAVGTGGGVPSRRADRLPDPGRQQRPRAESGRPHLGLRQGRRRHAVGRAVRGGGTRLPRAGRLARPRVGCRRRALRMERARPVGDGTARTDRLGRGPLDRLPRPRRDRPDADLRPPVRRQHTPLGQGAVVRIGTRSAQGDRQRPRADGRGPRARVLELPALGGIPDVRRDR